MKEDNKVKKETEMKQQREKIKDLWWKGKREQKVKNLNEKVKKTNKPEKKTKKRTYILS